MLYPSINKLLQSTDSRYSLVIAVAKRARQISDEAEQSHEVLEGKPVKLAINDIAAHRVKIVVHEPVGEKDEAQAFTHNGAPNAQDISMIDADDGIENGSEPDTDDDLFEALDNEE